MHQEAYWYWQKTGLLAGSMVLEKDGKSVMIHLGGFYRSFLINLYMLFFADA
jgi:hypothetical protein